MRKNTNIITISSSPAIYSLTIPLIYDKEFHINGTHAMAGAVSVNLATPSGGAEEWHVKLYYMASLSNYSIGSNYFQVAGVKLPAEYAQKRCVIDCKYNSVSGAWSVHYLPDFSQSAIVTSANIVDGTIVADDLASNSVTTAKVTDSNITLAKIQDIADDTILGNVSGSAAEPAELDAEDVRTLLDQDVTLTGHVTGTATQTFSTGVTTVGTTISNNTITVAMCTNTVNTDWLNIPVSMESSALTAGGCYIAVKAPYACTVEEWGFSVTDLIEATDDATISLYNTAGTLMGSSAVTVTKNTKPSTSAAGGSFFNSSTITSNNSISGANMFYIRVQKTTAGGRGFANIKIKRA